MVQAGDSPFELLKVTALSIPQYVAQVTVTDWAVHLRMNIF